MALPASLQRPSYAMGYARSGSLSASPHLWQGLFGAWSPTIGRQGTRLHDLVGRYPFEFDVATSPVWGHVASLPQSGPVVTWDRTAGSGLNAGDIQDFRFLSAEPWTLTFVYRINNTSVDNCTLIAKWAGSSTFKQLFIHVGFGTAPQEIVVFLAGAARITTANFVELNTWYCSAITNDGTGAAGGLRIANFAVPSGVLLNSGTGQHASDASNLTADVRLAMKDVSGNDIMDGSISATYFHQRVLDDGEVREIAQDDIAPLRLRASRPRVKAGAAPPAGGVPVGTLGLLGVGI